MSLLCPSLAVSLSLASSFRSLGRFSGDEPMALTSEGTESGKRGVQICDRGLTQQSPKTGGGLVDGTVHHAGHAELGDGAWTRSLAKGVGRGTGS